MDGEPYIELISGFPENYWLDPEYDDLARFYVIFDGDRTSSASDGIYYSDLRSPEPHITRMPFNRAVPIAEDFLHGHGLLDFPYQVAPPSGTSLGVDFRRLLDGRPVLLPEIAVSVNDTGRVNTMQHRVMRELRQVSAYPLLPAAEAWQTRAIAYRNGSERRARVIL